MRYRDPATGRIPADIRARERAFARTLPGSVEHLDKADRLQNTEWIRRGPYNIGGRTRAFGIDVSNERIFLAGGVSSGMWRSDDAGATWTKTTRPEQLHSVTCLAQDRRPGKTATWYYATGESWGNSAQIAGNGVYKSIDGGYSWEPLASTVSDDLTRGGIFGYAWNIVTDVSIDTADAVYVALTRGGIQRSLNGGTTWSAWAPSNSYFTDVAVTTGGTVYGAFSTFTGIEGERATRVGVWTVQESRWVNISPPDLPQTVQRMVIGIAPSNENIVYVLAETPGVGTKGTFYLSEGLRYEWHSLWRYDASTKTWENRSSNIPLFGPRAGDFVSQSGYDLLVTVSPADEDLVFLGGTNLYRSTDGFTSTSNSSWIGGYGPSTPDSAFRSYPNHHSDQHGLAFLPSDPNVAISFNDGGLQRSVNITADSVEWQWLNNGYFTTQFYAVCVKNAANDLSVMGGMQDNNTWQSTGVLENDPWVRRNGGDGCGCSFIGDGRELVVSSQQGRMRRVILDANGNEVARTRIDPVGGKDYAFVNPFAVDPRDQRILYLGGGQVLWRNSDITAIPLGSTDSTAVNWDSLPTTRISGTVKITAVSAADAPGHIVVYGTGDGRLYKLTDAHTGIPVPVEITGANMPGGATVSSIAFDPRTADHIVVTFSNYNVISVFATYDGGSTWSPVSGNLEENPLGGGNGPAVNSVAILPLQDDREVYIVGTSSGVYTAVELNGRSTVWSQTGATVIGNVPTEAVVARPNSPQANLFVGTHGTGVYMSAYDELPPPTPSPTLLLPPDGSRGILTDTVLRWNRVNGAISYSVQLAADASFTQVDTVIDGITADFTSIRGLIQGPRTYHWRVYAFGPGGKSQPSQTWSFSTAIVPPQLVSPIGGVTNVPGNPVRLTWNRVAGASSYSVQVATNISFSEVVYTRNGIADTIVDVSPLASSKRHYWRARSIDDAGAGVYSQRQQFTTGVLTSVDETNTDAVELVISPNPAFSVITVALDPEHVLRDDVQVEIVTSTGQRVLSTRARVNAGRMTIDVSALANGMYTLTVQGRTSMTATLQIVR
jgi:hypothetical protein